MKRDALFDWHVLTETVNGRTVIGQIGVRDPANPCDEYDDDGYDGRGRCLSDGHFMCTDCSKLSPEAPRFQEYGRDGRRDRLRLYFAHLRARAKGT